MAKQEVAIKTADGVCKTAVFTPSSGAGPWPAAIMYTDAFGIRPTFLAMAQRLADAGYVVLAPNLFYRYGEVEIPDPKTVFSSPDGFEKIRPIMASTDKLKAGADTGAFIAYLDTRKDVAGKKIGVTGYCMGGGLAMASAGQHPDRIAAVASFHGGGMATDDPQSPHLFAPKIKAYVYVAGADKDNSYPPEQAARLEKALSDAGVAHKCEIYPDALHGWTMPDFPIYKEDAAERHWRELSALFARTLN
jgi:carboxymethylenebutenolidase